MKLISVITPLVALFSVASAVRVHHDHTYDNANGLLSTTYCSNGGANTFSRFPHFSSLPSYPRIGAANGVECGECYQLKYNKNSIYVTVVSETVDAGFYLSLQAVNDLIKDGPEDQAQDAQEPKVFDAQSTKVDEGKCGL